MRRVHATKREVDMSERKLLFLMTAAQIEDFARLVEAANRGDGAAACRLGDMHREGLGGVRYSPKATYRWYAKSALAGDANGQNNLGACYEHGLGCAQSYPRAAKWYRLSAAQGLGTAAMNLGYCYLRGHGVPRDSVEALRLFREAVERGEKRAMQEVERLEREADSRVSEPVPAGTPSTRPWGLARRVPRRDGPPEQLRHPQVAAVNSIGVADHPHTLDTEERNEKPQSSGLRLRRPIRFVDETQPGKNFGLVGVTGVQPLRGGTEAAGGSPPADGPGDHAETEGEM
jgi:hypothetical protein